MKRFAFIVFCLICAAGGVALGRYVWTAPVEDAPVLRPSPGPQPQVSTARNVRDSLAALRNGPRRAALIISLAARGEKRHLPALIEACASDETALQFLGEAWMETDPGAFLKALASSQAALGVHREKCAGVLFRFLGVWGEKAPDEAWKCAESLTGTMRRYALSNLAGHRLTADARAGLEFLKAHPGVVPQAFPTLGSPEERAELLPAILEMPESMAKRQMIMRAVKDLPLSEAMQHAAVLTGSDAPMARNGILRQAAKRSPEEVIAWHSTATGTERYAAAVAVADGLQAKDPAAAAEWAQQHLSGSMRTMHLKKAAESLEAKDPAAAAALRALLPESYRPAAK